MLAAWAASLGGEAVLAQSFGRNQVVRRDFDWKVVSTEHFDIHYYAQSESLVPFAAKTLERSYARLSRGLSTGFDRRRPFFLYASLNDMQQSSIVDTGDGTGGVTEAFKDRFMVFNDGSRRWLDTVITHELTHVFQYHVLVSGWWKSARILKTIVYPLWMMEGMAEFFTAGLDDAPGEILIRDAATSEGLIPLWKLEHFSHLKPHQVRLAYEMGSAVLDFIEEQYGEGKVEALLKLFESRFDSSSVLGELTGLDIFGLDRKWREYAREKYRRVARLERLEEPERFGAALTRSRDSIPEFNSAPVFTPDGKSMAYFSTRQGYPPELMLKDLGSGRARRLMSAETRIETVELGNFADLSRVLALSPDGRRLAFFGKKNHEDFLYLFDLERRSLEKIPLPGLEGAGMPAFSPDGGSVAFSGLQEGISDLWLMRLEGRVLRRLNSDPQDDQSPAFFPDGKSLVYSSEVEEEGSAPRYRRSLYRLDLAGGDASALLAPRGAARDPVVSTDGAKVLFALEMDGFQETAELDLLSGRVSRLTRSYGACYTPVYTSSGAVAFAALRRGSVHIYAGPREGFLSETVAPDRAATRGSVTDPFIREIPLQVVSEPAVSTSASVMTPERPYTPSYSTDLFLPAFFYSSRGGLFWTSYWQGSDMLGVHQGQALITYASGDGYLNYQTGYTYSRWRPRLSLGAVGYVFNDSYDRSTGLTSDEFAHTQFAQASYPFDRFHRADLTVAAVEDRREFSQVGRTDRNDARIGMVSLVRDTVKGRYLVATDGSRLRLTHLESPRVLGGNFIYNTEALEAVKYLPTGGLSSFVVRTLAMQSVGKDTQQYVLGGIGGVRGFGRNSLAGSRLWIASAEWRFPVVGNLDYYMWYIFPDFYFKAVTAAVFSDAGHVWDTDAQAQAASWGTLRHSYGIGLRLHTFIMQLFPLVLHFDYARSTVDRGGVFYVYLGPLF